MNLSKLTKANLINQLEKRSLPTNGLKDELLKRLKEAIDRESVSEQDNQEENYDSEDENADEVVSEDKLDSNQGSHSSDKLNETLNDDEIVKEINSTAVLTVDDAINMKSTADVENYSMIVNVNDDDNSMPNSINDRTVEYEQTSGNRDIDNGEHEVIEISEEVIIDDEDNQENDNNYNDEQYHNDEIQQDKDELESGESREDEPSNIKEKITLWVHNVAEDVKAVELKELFGKYGKVTSAKVVMNGKDATGNCFGCIEFCNNEDVENCIKNLDKTEFRGNTITLSKNICDLTPKETIQRNISPVSSTDSWGGDGKNKEKSKSMSPFVCEPSTAVDKEDDNTQDDGKFKTSFRGRGGYRGNNYGSRDYGKNDGGDSHGRGGHQDYRRGSDNSRSNYGSRPDRSGGDDGPKRSFRSNNDDNDSRPRDNYPRRDNMRGSGGRDDYGSRGGESRYPAISRDRYPPKDAGGYSDRPNRSRYNDYDSGKSTGPPRYSGHDDHQNYDKRGDRRAPYHQDKDRGSSTSRRDVDLPFKRPRNDNDGDLYGAKSRRRDDYSPDRSGIPPRVDRYRAVSPKRSFYYSERDSYHRSDSRDKRDAYQPPSSDRRTDYSSRKPPADYGRPSSGHGPYSPVDRSRTSRSHNYSKESYPPTDFGGRSRNYDR